MEQNKNKLQIKENKNKVLKELKIKFIIQQNMLNKNFIIDRLIW
jgi:hypothetical protein